MIKRAVGSVFIIADDEVVRSGLERAVERAGGFCVSNTGALADAAGAAARLKPDVAVIEPRLQDGPDIKACRRIREACPFCHLVTLTSYVNHGDLVNSLLAGASACVLKQVRGRLDLAETIRRVYSGENLLRGQLGPYLERLLDPASSPLAGADRALLTLLSAQKTDSEIAASLHTSAEAVAVLIDSLGQKLTARR